MHKTKKHISIRIFFLALFLSYFADITFFTHSHIVNGATIIHSHYTFGEHPSKSGKQQGHTHNANALTLISQATSWCAIFQALPEVPEVLSSELFVYFITILPSKEQATPSLFYLRGPPMFS